MLIRSQNETKLINLNHVDSIVTDSRGNIYAYNGNGTTETAIGEYDSEEKAIAVLDMIVKAYNANDKTFRMPSNDSCSLMQTMDFIKRS